MKLERCTITINPSIKRALIKRHGRVFYRSLSIYLQSIDRHVSGHAIRYVNFELELDDFEVVGFAEFDIDDLENEVVVYSYNNQNNQNNQSKG